ncbi:MAG TPA: 5-deoxy-glucuronate isomerase, partial [Acidimicrobiia bacterium]|nr:5-deoxy-glucuronate isomerase [Acidimicrobiia bacterium]
AGESRSITLEGVEAAVVPLSGACRVETTEGAFDLTGRASPFTGIPDVAYVAAGSELTVTSEEGGRFAVATAVAEGSGPSFRVAAGDISVEVRGAGQATRQINGLLSADVPGPQRLIVVEVLTPEGNWSSYPPHKHDEWGEGEVPLEEIYYFEISKPEGFGFHRTYTKDGEIDESVTVASGDVFLIPRGYHGPCVAAPGYDMYYLNVMAGPDEERRWLITTDPDHAWVWKSWEGVPQDPRLPMTSAEKRDQRRRS